MTKEEAIKQIKYAMRRMGEDTKEALTFIVPELNESEDERVRKALIEALKTAKTVGELKFILPEPIRAECIAYLEKQKEQPTNEEMLRTLRVEYEKGVTDTIAKYEQKDASKAIEAVERIDKYIDEHLANAHDMKDSDPVKKYYRGWDDALGELAKILLDVYSGENQTEQKPAESISQLSVKGKGVYKICPYCKERMIRDDSKVYTSIPPQYGYNCPKCGAVEFDTVIYDNPEIEEQKQECSEDKRIREDIIALIKFALNDGSAVSPGSYTTKEEAIAYLEKLEDKKPVTIEQVYEKFLSSDTLKLAKENKYIRAQLFWELMHNGIITEVDYMYLTDDKRKPWTEEEYLKAYRNGFNASEQLKNLGV